MEATYAIIFQKMNKGVHGLGSWTPFLQNQTIYKICL